MARKDSKVGTGATTQPNAVEAVNHLLKTASLDGLQSEGYRTALDVLDRLRAQGLSSGLGLPQLVVCGNQSSGKSSVLEAITEVSFPRKEGLCSRFSTQVILRRAPKDSIRIRIIPDTDRSSDEKVKLSRFSSTITNFKELPHLIEQVTALMGLHALGGSSEGRQNKAIAFSRDVLSVEVSGQNRPQLTLVDLPGLVVSANKDQTKADVSLIRELIRDYLRNDRTIMLPVITAMDDLANQGILELCREFDPDRSRTLGIITKLDCLKDGIAKQRYWLDVAQNKNVSLKLGWHMLRNWSEEDGEFSFDDRNDAEQFLFSTGSYRGVRNNDKGVFELRAKLSGLLFNHVKREIPTVRDDAVRMRAAAQRERAQLGTPILEAKTQQRQLLKLAETFRDILKDATKGTYDEHDFFTQEFVDIVSQLPDDPEEPGISPQQGAQGQEQEQEEQKPTSDIDLDIPISYLRANVSKLQQNFTHQMLKYGHKYRIMPSNSVPGTQEQTDNWLKLLPQYEKAASRQQILTGRQAITWVKNRYQMTRGSEIPGTSTTPLVSQIFHEQCENWEVLAEEHIANVEAACSGLVGAVLYYLTPRHH